MPILLLQKPTFNSKPKDNATCLECRLKLWLEGNINALVLEGRCLQKHLHKSAQNVRNKDNTPRSFANLMFSGKTEAALGLLSNTHTRKGGVLLSTDLSDPNNPSSPTVLETLKKKHPPGRPIQPSALIGVGDPPPVHPVLFDRVDAGTIKSAALNTKGAAGPSGLDAHSWRRLCTSFHSASRELCHSLAMLTRRLCTSFVDPDSLSPFLACRLIALDKCPGIRPIGICETARRIVSKAILTVIRDDLQDAAGSTQLCAGQIAGVEAAIHFMRSCLTSDDTEAVLMVDASNAFNSLNRECALHNIRYVCPSIATVLINTYRRATELFVGDSTLLSTEGTTQGDSLAMPMYAMATVPLINHLNTSSNAKQVWYADDSSAAGTLDAVYQWWKTLNVVGPAFGYFVNPSKTWLLTKTEHLARAKTLFQDTDVNITTQGRPYLGAPQGSTEYIESFVSDKVNCWIEMIESLSEIAKSQPHAALAAYIHGLVHKFSFLFRTTPNIEQFLRPLEECIRAKFIPSVCGRTAPNDLERDLLGLPPRLGRIGIANPAPQSARVFSSSFQTTLPLVDLIQKQCPEYPLSCIEAQLKAKRDARQQCQDLDKRQAQSIRSCAPTHLQRAIELAQEKGASSWLTTVPLKEHKFVLHKRALHDALALRYGWSLRGVPTHCACGAQFSVEHELSCPKGGFTIQRHNEVRDLTANILSEVCHNVCTEPSLQPLTGEQLTGTSAITDNAARLDIAADGFWGGRHERAFFDVRIFNPLARSNNQPIQACYRKHENEKKRAYEQRVREIEHGSFTPLVLSASGGMGCAASVFYKRLASKLAEKTDSPYSTTLAWLRSTLSFALLRSAIQSIRGTRSTSGRPLRDSDQVLPCFELVTLEARLSN